MRVGKEVRQGKLEPQVEMKTISAQVTVKVSGSTVVRGSSAVFAHTIGKAGDKGLTNLQQNTCILIANHKHAVQHPGELERLDAVEAAQNVAR